VHKLDNYRRSFLPGTTGIYNFLSFEKILDPHVTIHKLIATEQAELAELVQNSIRKLISTEQAEIRQNIDESLCCSTDRAPI
jgi:hypothetical protein